VRCEECLVLGPVDCPKTVVWWCVSVICEEDISLDGIISPATRERIQEDPGKLFRYFETLREAQCVEGTDLFRSELFTRRSLVDGLEESLVPLIFDGSHLGASDSVQIFEYKHLIIVMSWANSQTAYL